jgi:hypothetical protein
MERRIGGPWTEAFEVRGYLEKYLRENGMYNNSFFLEGFLVNNPVQLKCVTSPNDEYMKQLILYVARKNPKAILFIDTERFEREYKDAVKRNLGSIIDKFDSDVWYQVNRLKVKSPEIVLAHIVSEYHLDPSADLKYGLLSEGKGGVENVKRIIRESGNRHNKAALMELTLSKVDSL